MYTIKKDGLRVEDAREIMHCLEMLDAVVRVPICVRDIYANLRTFVKEGS